MTGIYKITSTSGRVYIGQSVKIKNRINRYSNGNCKGQVRLYQSILKYGWINHVLEVIEECTVEMLNERERYWQDHYDVLGKKGLNCRITSTHDKSGFLSKEVTEKMSKALTGRKMSKESIEKSRAANKGRFLGLKSPTSYRIISLNKKTGEKIVNTLFDTAKHFKVDRELIMNRLKGVSGYKLNDWIFYKEGENIPTIVPRNRHNKYVFDVNSGVYYYSLKEAGESIGINGKLLWYRIKNKKCENLIIS